MSINSTWSSFTKANITASSFYDYNFFTPVLTSAQYGSTLLVLSFLFTIFQCAVLFIICKKEVTADNIAFKITKHQGFFTLIQLLGHLITSFIIMINVDGESLFVSIIGSIIRSSFIVGVLFTFVLTINRFFIVFCFLSFLYDKKSFYHFLILLCYIISVIEFTVFVLPSFRLSLDQQYFKWYIIGNFDKIELVWVLQSKIIIIILIISFIMHILIMLKMMFLRCLTRGSIITCNELNFIAYALINFAFCAIYELGVSGLVNFLKNFEFCSAYLQVFYTVITGINIIYTYCFVKNIHQDVLPVLANIVNSNITKIRPVTSK
uniref:Serpentine Receptor, class Z n=1 Tax=Strongyloides venezuelensis TaxID=75913 RepID=A0A0K0EVP1_STRVS